MMDEHFWDDRKKAQALINEKNGLVSIIESYQSLDKRYASMDETVDMLKSEFDEEMMAMIEDEVVEAQSEFESDSMFNLNYHFSFSYIPASHQSHMITGKSTYV